MRESYVVKACIEWLHLNGCFVWRNNTGAYKHHESGAYIRYGLTGSADIIGVNPKGRFIAVECKSDKGKLSESQYAFGAKVKVRRGVYVLARSIDDLEAVRTEILG
jgi:hypothetical protein